MRRLGEKAMRRIPKDALDAECNAARPAAHAAREINKQRMRAVNSDPHLFHLFFQTQGSHRIAQKQVLGILIIDKITVRIGLGLAAALGNRLAVVVFIFDDMDAKAAQHILFPLARVGRHMDCHMKPKLGAHYPDGKAQIAR